MVLAAGRVIFIHPAQVKAACFGVADHALQRPDFSHRVMALRQCLPWAPAGSWHVPASTAGCTLFLFYPAG